MAVTTLDSKTALIVIDLQKGIVAYPTVHPIDGVVKNAAALAAVFRKHGLPVALVDVTGAAPGRTEQPRTHREFPPDWADIIPEINQQPQDHVVTKQTPGAFTNTRLYEFLMGSDVTQVVIIGVATSNGVETTARQAFELGFNITFATDAMTDRDAEAHHNSISRIFPKIGETGTTQDIINLLEMEV